MNRLIDAARERLAAMKAGADAYPDDDVFMVVRGRGRAADGDRPEHAPQRR